jgi:hypothetical protein
MAQSHATSSPATHRHQHSRHHRRHPPNAVDRRTPSAHASDALRTTITARAPTSHRWCTRSSFPFPTCPPRFHHRSHRREHRPHRPLRPTPTPLPTPCLHRRRHRHRQPQATTSTPIRAPRHRLRSHDPHFRPPTHRPHRGTAACNHTASHAHTSVTVPPFTRTHPTSIPPHPPDPTQRFTSTACV